MVWDATSHHIWQTFELEVNSKLSPGQFASIMIIEKDSKDRNKYTEAHSYLILQAGEAIGKFIEDEQQKCVDSG